MSFFRKFPAPALLLILFITGAAAPVRAQLFEEARETHIQELDFRNQPLRDVLLSLARYGGISLIPDETLDGYASYYFADISLTDAFLRIIQDEDLYVIDQGEVRIISRMQLKASEEEGISLHAEDVDYQSILRALDRISSIPIRWRDLPADRTSIHLNSSDVQGILSALLAPFPEYRIEEHSEYLLVSRSVNGSSVGDSTLELKGGDESWDLSCSDAQLSDIISALMHKTDDDYFIYFRGGPPVYNLELQGKSVDEIVALLSLGTGLRTRMQGGVRLFFLDGGEYRPVLLSEYRCRNRTPGDLAALFPPELFSSVSLRADDREQLLWITSNEDDANAVARTLNRLDVPRDTEPMRYRLNFLGTQEFFALLPEALRGLCFADDSQTGVFYAVATDGQHRELGDLLSELDVWEEYHSYQLSYLSAGEILAALPPSFPREGLSASADGSRILYRGEMEAFEELCRYFSSEDTAPDQIEYHLLIVQYQENARSNFSMGLNAGIMTSDSRTGFSAQLSSVLGLTFDILSNFGYSFASALSWDLSHSRARIIADTNLLARNGEELRLDNTSTYRYRDSNDEDGSPAVIREIVTGLSITLHGRILGDSQLDVHISVDLSKRGTDTSGDGNPPPTSERSFSSRLLLDDGIVTKAANLVLEERSTSSRGVLLSGGRDKSSETSQLVIYILPYILTRTPPVFELPPPQTMIEELLDD